MCINAKPQWPPNCLSWSWPDHLTPWALSTYTCSWRPTCNSSVGIVIQSLFTLKANHPDLLDCRGTTPIVPTFLVSVCSHGSCIWVVYLLGLSSTNALHIGGLRNCPWNFKILWLDLLWLYCLPMWKISRLQYLWGLRSRLFCYSGLICKHPFLKPELI